MLCVAAVLRYCIVALAVSVYLEVGVMEKLQKMYFISMKADDKTLQCYVDVRIMQQIRNVFRFFGLGLFCMGGHVWYVLVNFEVFCMCL